MFTLETYREKAGNWKFIAIFGVLYFVSQILIAHILNKVGSLQAFRLQTTLDSVVFKNIIDNWSRAGLIGIYRSHFYPDMFHPIWYSLFLSSFIAKGLKENNISHKFDIIMLAPFGAAVLDLFENVIHLLMIANYNLIRPAFVIISGTATNAKWTLAAVSILTIIVLFARRIFMGKSDG